jgi:hypothetical protein
MTDIEFKDFGSELRKLNHRINLLRVSTGYLENAFDKLLDYLEIKPIRTVVAEHELSINILVVKGYKKIKSCDRCGHELKG